MVRLDDKKVLVIGLGLSGVAASRFLAGRGAHVYAVDSADNDGLRAQAEQLRSAGVHVDLGVQSLVEQAFELAVVSPGVPPNNAIFASARERGIPVIGELELGWQNSLCLNIAITGTNGKTTTTELIE